MEQSEREVLERQVKDFRKEAASALRIAAQMVNRIQEMKDGIESYEALARAKDAAADRIEAMLRGAP